MPKGLRKLTFSVDGDGLTRFAGLVLFQAFCKSLGLRRFLQRRVNWPVLGRKYHLVDLFLTHIVAIAAGIGRIENIRSLKHNGLLPSLLGLPEFPHRDTLRTFLLSADAGLLTITSARPRPFEALGSPKRASGCRHDQLARLWPADGGRCCRLCAALFSPTLLQCPSPDRGRHRSVSGRRIQARQYLGRCRYHSFRAVRFAKTAFARSHEPGAITSRCRILRWPTGQIHRRERPRIHYGRQSDQPSAICYAQDPVQGFRWRLAGRRIYLSPYSLGKADPLCGCQKIIRPDRAAGDALCYGRICLSHSGYQLEAVRPRDLALVRPADVPGTFNQRAQVPLRHDKDPFKKTSGQSGLFRNTSLGIRPDQFIPPAVSSRTLSRMVTINNTQRALRITSAVCPYTKQESVAVAQKLSAFGHLYACVPESAKNSTTWLN